MEFGTWIKKRIAGENISLGIPKEQQNLNGLILEEAIAFHIAWRERWITALREHREDEFDAAQVSNDALCQVGEWIYNEGKSLAKLNMNAFVNSMHSFINVPVLLCRCIRKAISWKH